MSSGTHGTFLVGSIIAVAMFVAALFVKEVPLRGSAPAPEPEKSAPADAAALSEPVA